MYARFSKILKYLKDMFRHTVISATRNAEISAVSLHRVAIIPRTASCESGRARRTGEYMHRFRNSGPSKKRALVI